MRMDNKNVIKNEVSIDDLDRKILHQLDINSRQSTAEISKKVGSNKDTVNYRISKLLENNIIKRFSLATNTSKFGYQNIKVYFQFQNFSKEIEKEFFDYLRSIPRIGWVVRSSGRWDALFCYWAKSSFEFYSVFIKILNKFSEYIYHKEIVHNINWFYYNRKWIYEKDTKIYPILYGEQLGNEKLDELDTKILEKLIDNAKMPIKDIAFETNQSAQTIINRIRNLQKRDIITKFSIDLNYEKLGILFCKTFVYLDNITKKRLEELYSYCAKQPNIFALTTTLGAWDIELEIEVHKFEEVISIMDDLRDKFKDIIRSYESIIITKQSEVIYIGK